MIRLNISREPRWIDIPGFDIKLHVRPLSSAIVAAARERARRIVGELAEHATAVHTAGGVVAELPDLSDPDARYGLIYLEFTVALAAYSVIDWQGVFDRSGADKAKIGEQAIRDLMSIYPIGERFRDAYLETSTLIEAEKNVSGPAPNGTTAAGPDIARGAAPTDSPAPTAGSASAENAALTSNTRH